MKTSRILKSLLAVAVALPMSLSAQVSVNREKYPDYSDKQNPDWSLMQYASMQKSAARADAVPAEQRPAYVNNAELKFFPPVFNQDGGSCGSASRISYMFTYELNAYRDLDGKVPENYYPSHFVWLLTNGNSGKDQFVTSIGVPSAATYGGQTYSSLFGNQVCEDDDFGWMQGYDKWFEAMHNRMYAPSNFPLHVGTEEGREAVKNWLWNHNGDTSFKAGGICGIGVASSDGVYDGKIPSTEANKAAGVTGKAYLKAWGTQVDHALTIVGYDDRIEFDLDGNGVAGEVEKDEVGAWIIVNSWGQWWGNRGFIYCPYAYGGASSNVVNGNKVFAGNWWAPEIYKVRKDYRPLRTIKLEMEYSRRSEIKLSAGISTDINATEPDNVIAFEHFKFAGDGNYGNTNPAPEIPMLGRWADGKLHKEPMEFGYDLTDMSAGYDKSQPLKYFFIVETRDWAQGEGKIHAASIIDYEHETDGVETPFVIPSDGVTIKNAGEKTIISVVVYGEPYYAPQNVSITGNNLAWEAPINGGKTIEKYNIYQGSTKVAEVDGNTTTYVIPETIAIEGQFGVTALYSEGYESYMTTVTAPVAEQTENKTLNLKVSGMGIPGIFDKKYENATIEFWIKPNSVKAWNQSAGPGWGTFMMHAESNGAFTVGWDTSNRLTTGASTLQTNRWRHIAIVVKGNKLTVFVNGVPKKSITSKTYSGIGGFGELVFTASSSNNNFTDGSFDEIRFWDKARTAEEIKASYNAQFSGDLMPEGLIGYYKGDLITVDGEEKLRDYIGSNHARILNSSYSVDDNTQTFGSSTAALSAEINAPSNDIYVGTPVTLSAKYSDSAKKLYWNIEDAGVTDLNVIKPTVTFKTAGEQKITVTVEDSEGNKATSELTVNVLAEKPIDATFRASKDPIVMGEKVHFIVENPAFGQLYEWSFPGAEVEQFTGLHASAVYKVKGKQTATLKVTSITSGKSATSSIEVQILESEPVAAFSISPAVILKGEKTYLKDESKYNPSEWEWTIESNKNCYVINGQNSSFTPTACGVYNVTLKASNEIGSGSYTRERGIIVCNADSKNGLSFSGRENARVTATTNGFSGQRNVLTVEWWMCPDQLGNNCLGLGESTSTFMIHADEKGIMHTSASGYTGKSQQNYVIPNEWHHYAVILDNGFVDYYRDGEHFSTSYVSSSASIPSLSKFSIGLDGAGMNGQIDELRVWGKIVKDDELRAVCNGPIENPAEYSDLLLYYDFNQSGGDVIDRTANGNNGVRSGFGPDGDAWGLSKGVFCLNTEAAETSGDVTAEYLTNYKASFKYNAANQVNKSIANRFYAIKDWTLENAPVSGTITTGAHVDKNKGYCMTFTTTWDGFGSLNDHKTYQTVTLPKGNYKLTVNYHSTWEGQCGNSYVVAAKGTGLPNTADLDDAITYTKMAEKGSVMSNFIEFSLTEETKVSLGLLVNMSGQSCMAIQSFVLERDNTVYIDADGETTSIECITEVTEQYGNGAIYDLQGRKVLQPQKGGIYIKNGKKFFVK